MDSETLRVIVKTLASEGTGCLVRDRKKFFDSLQIPPGDYYPIEKNFLNNTATWYDFLHFVLSCWISKNGTDATTGKIIQILQNEDFHHAADLLTRSCNLAHFGRTKITRFGLFKVPKNFTGRTKELDQMQDMFYSNKQLLVITGLGGIGKTVLAMKFTSIVTESLIDCICLNGETIQTLRDCIAEFASEFGSQLSLPRRGRKGSISKAFTSVVQNVLQRKKFVLVIDNVDEANEEVISLIDALENEQVFVIVTSRDITVVDFEGERIHLGPLLTEDSILLVQSSVEGSTVRDASELCKLLENFPLALQQALAYIKERKITSLKGNRFSIQDYIRQYEKQKDKVLAKQLTRLQHSFQTTTLIVWNTTICKLPHYGEVGLKAIEILKLLAYLRPFVKCRDIKFVFESTVTQADSLKVKTKKRYRNSENIKMYDVDGVDIGILSDTSSISEESDEESDFSAATILLKKFSLIQVENTFVSIHRLVQEVIRLTQDKEQAYLKRTLCHIAEQLQTGSKFWNENFTDPILKIMKKSDELLAEFSSVPAQIYEHSFSNEGNKFLELLRLQLGSNHIDVLRLELSQSKNNFFLKFDYLPALSENYKIVDKIMQQLDHIPDSYILDTTLGSLVYAEKVVGNAEKYLINCHALLRMAHKHNDTKSKQIVARIEKELSSMSTTKSIEHIKLQNFIMTAVLSLGDTCFLAFNYVDALKYLQAYILWYGRFTNFDLQTLPIFTAPVCRRYALCHYHLGNVEESLEILDKVHKSIYIPTNYNYAREPNIVEYHNTLQLIAKLFIHLRFRQTVQSLQDNFRIQSVYKSFVDTMKKLAVFFYKYRNIFQSEKCQKVLFDLKTFFEVTEFTDSIEGKVWVQHLQGKLFYSQNRFEDALKLFKDVVRVKRDDKETFYVDSLGCSIFWLGATLFQLGQYENGGENMVEGIIMIKSVQSMNLVPSASISTDNLDKLEKRLGKLFAKL